MNAADFIKEFGHFADAPNGVQKLREMILQLAVQGKLVPQNPQEEPASILLKKVEAEKHRLAKEGKIRKSKILPLIASNEVCYKLPKGWQWRHLGDIAEYGTTSKVNSTNIPNDAWLLELEDIEKDTSRIIQRVTFADRESKSTKAHFMHGDVLYGKLRPYLNKVVVADAEGYCTTEIVPIRLFGDINPYYIMTVLKSPSFVTHVNELTYGVKMPRLGTDDARLTLIPLPPLAEQSRIVVKVDELMRCCDELEALQKEKQAKRITLNASCLNALMEVKHEHGANNIAQKPRHILAAQKRIFDNFDILYDNPENVSELRKAILQLAVQGRLVPQDPNDEPASALLKKIATKKERLIKEGKIKKTGILQPIRQKDFPFKIPATWEWTHLADICTHVTDGDHLPPPKTTSGIPFLVIGNISSGYLDFSNTRFVSQAYYDALDPMRIPAYGDLLYTVTGSYGISLVVETTKHFCVQRHIAILKLPSNISPLFLKYWISAPLFKQQADKGATGIAQKTVSLSVLRNMITPIPPLAAQKRIVAKVDVLMQLCNEVELKLTQSKSEAESLIASVVNSICNSAKESA